jgi:hypothetical protein
VKTTAEEFAKTLLGVTTLPPDLVQDDKETAALLGNIADGKKLMDKMKKQIFDIMHQVTNDYNI